MESRCLDMRAEKAVQQLTGEECPPVASASTPPRLTPPTRRKRKAKAKKLLPVHSLHPLPSGSFTTSQRKRLKLLRGGINSQWCAALSMAQQLGIHGGAHGDGRGLLSTFRLPPSGIFRLAMIPELMPFYAILDVHF